MADISKIKIGSTTYNIKDTTARDSISKIKYGTTVMTLGSTYKNISSAISYGVTYTNLPYIFLSFGLVQLGGADTATIDNTTNAQQSAGLSLWAGSVTTTNFKISLWNWVQTAGDKIRIYWLSIGK